MQKICKFCTSVILLHIAQYAVGATFHVHLSLHLNFKYKVYKPLYHKKELLQRQISGIRNSEHYVHLSQIKFFHIQVVFLLKWQLGWKRSLTKNRTRGMERSLNQNAKNRTEREDRSSTQNGTERMENRTIKENENGIIWLKALVLERNGMKFKKLECAQPLLYCDIHAAFYK